MRPPTPRSGKAQIVTPRLGLYEPFKELLGAKDPKTTPLWKKFLAGLLSGSVGAIVANPADLLKVKRQSNESKGKLLSVAD